MEWSLATWIVSVLVSLLVLVLTLLQGVMKRRIQELETTSAEGTKAIEQLTKALGKANDAMVAAEYLAVKEKRRADEQFAVIEDFDKEKRQIWEIYRDSCLGAGNCQDLLFNEMSRIVRLHNALAKKHGFDPIEIRPAVRDALRRFADDHRNEPAIKAKIDAHMGRPSEESAERRS